MTLPSALADALAAIMLATAAYCVGRLLLAHRLHREVEHEVDTVHVLMGVALAGMLVPTLDPLDGAVWTGVFAATTLWSGARAVLIRRGTAPKARTPSLRHRLPHVVLSGAMLYMYLAPAGITARPDGTGGPGTGTGMTAGLRYPAPALLLALFLCGYAATVLDRTPLHATPMTARRAAATPPTAPTRAPALVRGSAPGASAPASAEHGGLPAPGHLPPLAPRGANCCDIAMSLTMALLLIVLL